MNPRGLPRLRGNNADAGVVRVTIMGGVTKLTGPQEMGMDQAFERHKMHYRLSQVGFLSDTFWLDDGTRVEVTTNAGRHEITIWPIAAKESKLQDVFYCVPGDGDGVSSWDPKLSAYWRFNGQTVPPTKFKPQRKVDDHPDIRQHPGNLTWWNTDMLANGKPIIVSWIGRGTRYGRADYYGWQLQEACSSQYEDLHGPADGGSSPSAHRTDWPDAFHPWVWIQGVRHEIKQIVDDAPVEVPVISAALRRIDGVTYLYVVTFDTDDNSLEVHRGPVDPYSTSCTVEFQFAIPFVIDSTPLSGGNPQWEALQQPPYFNKSCTFAAGLVIVKDASANNPEAAVIESGGYDPTATYGAGNSYMAKLMVVDIDDESTAFTSEHAGSSSSTVIVGDTSGTTTTTTIKYGAVDWEDDDMRIALCKHILDSASIWAGTWDTPYDPGLPEAGQPPTIRDGVLTYTARTRISIYLEHDDTVLAERDSGTHDVLVMTFDAFTAQWHDMGFSDGYGWESGTGSFVEDLTADLYRGCDVAAGDLRHRFVVMTEHMETGTLDVDWSIEPIIGTDLTSGFGNAYITAFNSSVMQRKSGIRYSAWREGVEMLTSTTSSQSFATFLQFHTVFGTGYGQSVSTLVLDDLLLATELFNPPGPGTYSSSTLKFDRLGDIEAFNPFVSNARPYILACAFTPDGFYGFYDIGTSVASFSVAQFLIGEDTFTVTPGDLVPDITSAGLASPVFLYQVPTEYPFQ